MFVDNLTELQSLESWSTRKTTAICVNVIEETHDVKTFQFKTEQAQLFHFKPGQFIGIQVTIDGERHNRSYTIASSPTRPHVLELTVKLDPAGSVSPWLHQNIKVGSSLELRGPAGRFNCMDIKSNKVLLISAGSGITPVMSMARFWCDQSADKDIHFVNWSRSVQDIIFRRELALLDHQHANFNLEVVCTKPGLTENWLGRRGRLNKNLLLDIVPDLHERTIFCCGPEGFMEQLKTCLQQLDFDMSQYHDETFDPGGKKKSKLAAEKVEAQKMRDEKPDGPFNLTFKKTGKTVIVEADEILLERIEAEGIAIESACRAGNCGCCQVKKLSGDTNTVNEIGLHSERKQENFILTCTTRLESDVELDI
ncbi:hybrid-cluster NAD(P)-dependent oxidoreductase [Aliikangiella coralliicola]|uniref:Hybrid-cluster NAD(P)-dependent oxidoreductase n=1 Tax=Aliikangiella coralliicola TaxID=2592383 RepID=A0A545UGS7_9GAMM|nr:hybrid-cluster NAD(P)-dependent oxidoreductase [Aliikangiella coralliicola]TQV88603.1 hybrid-cluster NAD(P)-dependent oxidoreductase [Aliikangiella coralliicola]